MAERVRKPEFVSHALTVWESTFCSLAHTCTSSGSEWLQSSIVALATKRCSVARSLPALDGHCSSSAQMMIALIQSWPPFPSLPRKCLLEENYTNTQSYLTGWATVLFPTPTHRHSSKFKVFEENKVVLSCYRVYTV